MSKNKPPTNLASEVVPEQSNAVRLFRAKCDTALLKINNIKQFRESDEMVDFVFRVGRSLFDQPLDQMDVAGLIRQGGKLTGAYAYLGQMSSRARAERDVYEQKCDEVQKELVLKYVGEKYKVTEAKARASAEMEELEEFVIQKDATKNQWEGITSATQMMVMFIQSAIRVKEGEKFTSGKLHNNG